MPGSANLKHLEHFMQFWSSLYRKVVEVSERIEKRFTRFLPGLKGISYM